MKKHQKTAGVNNQEDENLEYYILYPENAVACTNLPETVSENEPGFKIEKSNNKKFDKATNMTKDQPGS